MHLTPAFICHNGFRLTLLITASVLSILHDIHKLLISLASNAGVKVAYKVDNVPFYKHTEEFRLGQSVSMSRRDKKSGQQHATMRAVPKGVEVDIQLDPPFSGETKSSLHASCSVHLL